MSMAPIAVTGSASVGPIDSTFTTNQRDMSLFLQRLFEAKIATNPMTTQELATQWAIEESLR
jgi:hypothetical protein